MKRRYNTLLMVGLALLLSYEAGNAQQVVSSSGGEGSGTNGTLSYTLGEIIIDTQTAGNNTITQGFHQPKLIVTALREMAGENMSIKAYPNPAHEFVILKISESDFKDCSWQLYDLSGRLLLQEKLLEDEVTIPMTNRSPGTYLLKITQSGMEVQEFKIIKQ